MNYRDMTPEQKVVALENAFVGASIALISCKASLAQETKVPEAILSALFAAKAAKVEELSAEQVTEVVAGFLDAGAGLGEEGRS